MIGSSSKNRAHTRIWKVVKKGRETYEKGSK